jgi:hypothetical protein
MANIGFKEIANLIGRRVGRLPLSRSGRLIEVNGIDPVERSNETSSS